MPDTGSKSICRWRQSRQEKRNSGSHCSEHHDILKLLELGMARDRYAAGKYQTRPDLAVSGVMRASETAPFERYSTSRRDRKVRQISTLEY